MIKSITLNEQYTKRIKRKELGFKPGVNLLVGPNGSGKSSIIDAIVCKQFEREKDKIEIKTTCEFNYMKFDFEKDNLRTRRTVESMGQILSFWKSHGETVKALLGELQSNISVFLLDEPEQALDIDGIEYLLECLHKTKSPQVIIATHSPVLILCPDFHIIELVKGYRERVRKNILALAWSCS